MGGECVGVWVCKTKEMHFNAYLRKRKAEPYKEDEVEIFFKNTIMKHNFFW